LGGFVAQLVEFLLAAVSQQRLTGAHQMLSLLASIIMPRTTLDLDKSVLEQLRRRAVSERKSMGQVASERLAVGLGESAPKELPRLRWPSRHMGKPVVDLEDKDALWKALEDSRPQSRTR